MHLPAFREHGPCDTQRHECKTIRRGLQNLVLLQASGQMNDASADKAAWLQKCRHCASQSKLRSAQCTARGQRTKASLRRPVRKSKLAQAGLFDTRKLASVLTVWIDCGASKWPHSCHSLVTLSSYSQTTKSLHFRVFLKARSLPRKNNATEGPGRVFATEPSVS